MINLYLPQTSYHVLLSLAIAASCPGDDNFMVTPGCVPDLLELPRLFPKNNMKNLCFGRANAKSNPGRFFLKKRNLKTLEKTIKDLPPIDRIYYSCEWHVYTTYAVHLVSQINPSVEFNFVEDGVSTYAEKSKKRKNIVERFLDKLAYGSWHRSIGVPGTLR